MEKQDLQMRLASWENLGPMRSLEDLLREMGQYASTLDAAAASTIVELLCDLERDRSSLLGPLAEFIDIYAKLFPEALSSELLRKIGPNGPPILVELLGSARTAATVEALRRQVSLEQADEDLLVALASALGEIGSPEAITMLHELLHRPALPESARREIQIAFKNLGHSV